MKESDVRIEEHSYLSKSFEMYFPHDVRVYVDYDDVNHEEVNATVETLKEIVEKHWDEKVFKEKLKIKVMELWNKNEYDLQSDYNSFEEFLKERLGL